MEIKDVLNRVPSPIVFDHLAHIPEPEGTAHPLFGVVLALIDKGNTWVKLSGAYADTKVGPPSYSDSSAIARAYVQKAPERLWVQWAALAWGAAFAVHLWVFARGTLATMGRSPAEKRR